CAPQILGGACFGTTRGDNWELSTLSPSWSALSSFSLSRARRAHVGVHYLLDLFECPVHLLTAATLLEDIVLEAIRRGRTSLVKDIAHQFHPHGVTVVALLKESHLSLHTWPEHAFAASDIFTCGETAQPRAACEALKERLQPRFYRMKRIVRG